MENGSCWQGAPKSTISAVNSRSAGNAQAWALSMSPFNIHTPAVSEPGKQNVIRTSYVNQNLRAQHCTFSYWSWSIVLLEGSKNRTVILYEAFITAHSACSTCILATKPTPHIKENILACEEWSNSEVISALTYFMQNQLGNYIIIMKVVPN